MKIVNAVCAPGRSGFYFDDQQAIKDGAIADGANYRGTAVTEGFKSVRQAGESISIMLVLEDGQVAFGDCAAVQYSGAGGRDPLFLADDFIKVIEEHVFPSLIGKSATHFKQLAEELEALKIAGQNLHTAIRYGVSQALLDAVAKANKMMMCEVIADEYGLALTDTEVPIFMQSGDSRYDNVDKMIIKEADILPHALINNITKLGQKGELLKEYIEWMRDRIIQFRTTEHYVPIFHIDVYGTIGQIFADDYDSMVHYFASLEAAAKPFKLRIEGPIDAGDREKQMVALATITKMIDERGINVEIVADEWCNTFEDIKYFADARAGHMIQVKTPDLGGINNTVEAVLYCKEKGVGAYQGGTCNETNVSAQVCVHLAMATKPDQMLAKPGMGVDEGFMIVYNEMQRIRALLKLKEAVK